jgi:hypothetical protein
MLCFFVSAIKSLIIGIENAWIGGHGLLGRWSWVDTGISIFQQPPYTDVDTNAWPPMRYCSSEAFETEIPPLFIHNHALYLKG